MASTFSHAAAAIADGLGHRVTDLGIVAFDLWTRRQVHGQLAAQVVASGRRVLGGVLRKRRGRQGLDRKGHHRSNLLAGGQERNLHRHLPAHVVDARVGDRGPGGQILLDDPHALLVRPIGGDGDCAGKVSETAPLRLEDHAEVGLLRGRVLGARRGRVAARRLLRRRRGVLGRAENGQSPANTRRSPAASVPAAEEENRRPAADGAAVCSLPFASASGLSPFFAFPSCVKHDASPLLVHCSRCRGELIAAPGIPPGGLVPQLGRGCIFCKRGTKNGPGRPAGAGGSRSRAGRLLFSRLQGIISHVAALPALKIGALGRNFAPSTVLTRGASSRGEPWPWPPPTRPLTEHVLSESMPVEIEHERQPN